MAVFMPITDPSMATSGPPELPGLIAASVWMNFWNWFCAMPLGVGLVDGAVFGGDDAGRNGLRKAEGAADGEHPVADLRAVGVAELDGGEGFFGVDFNDGHVGVFVDADDSCGAAEVASAAFGVGGKLDENSVGFIDDVVVGDDVAARVNDEAGAESAALAAAHLRVVVATVGVTLVAEEAAEEVLHVLLVFGVLAAPGRGRLRRAGAGLAICSVLMLTTAGPTFLAICEKPFESVTGEGIERGRASVELTCCCSSLPETLLVRTEPASRPIESAERMVKAGTRRPARSLSMTFSLLMFSLLEFFRVVGVSGVYIGVSSLV